MNTAIISAIKSTVKRELMRLQSYKYSIKSFAQWGQYKRISDSDRISFNQVLSIWRPEGKNPLFMLRWNLTEWCNYKCPYCLQIHDRFARKGKYTAHAFDNHPLEKWCHAFSRHFQERRLSLVITGGEPMLDRRNMVPLLKELTSMPTVECIRIDTNASWKPDNYTEVDPKKIILNCSYHPSQVSKESFLNSIKQLLDFGYKIGMVNFVMDTDNFDIFKKVKEEIFELGIPTNPNPQFNLEGPYSAEHLAVLKEELPHADFLYKTQMVSPFGNKCLFPFLGYLMDQSGQIHVGCHPQVSGSFFEKSLPPTFTGPVPCPNKSCMCLDMYSFLEDVNRNKDVNPFLVYSDILKNKYLSASDRHYPLSLNEIESNTDKSCYNKIKLYRFGGCRNFGDELNEDILRYIGVDYCCTGVDESNLIAIGSLLTPLAGTVTDRNPGPYPYYDCIDIWGAGFIQKKKCKKEFFIKNVNIHALRGNLSKARSEAILGRKLDGIALGDPGLLISRAINVGNVEKKYDVGVIPHYVDKDSDLLNKIKLQNKSYKIIDVQENTHQICKEICECRLILSSAMHGLIVADSYGIPNKWIRFSDDIIGGNYKFDDYYSVFDIKGLEPIDLRKEIITDQDIDLFITHYPIKKEDVERICDDLEKAFPRKRAATDRKIFKKKSIKEILKTNPLVSIIISSYNHSIYLSETLDSVLAQTYTNWECIIVNDGSLDNTEEIARQYCEKDVRFKYIYQKNRGPAAARNTGIKKSKGEFILPLDSDDLISKDYLTEAVSIFEARPATKMVYCRAELFGEAAGLWKLPKYSFDELLFADMIFCTAMYKRSDYDRTNGYNQNMKEGFEDWDFWLSLLKKDDLVYQIPEVHFYYRIRNNSRGNNAIKNKESAKKMFGEIFSNHTALYEGKINPLYTEYLLHQKNEECRQKDREILHLKQAVTERDKQIARLGGCGVRDQEAALNHIYNFHGWRALVIYYKIREKIFPVNSRRRKIAKFVKNLF